MLGNLISDFNFDQSPRAPVILPVHPQTTLTGTPTNAASGAASSSQMTNVVACFNAHGVALSAAATARQVKAAFDALSGPNRQSLYTACACRTSHRRFARSFNLEASTDSHPASSAQACLYVSLRVFTVREGEAS